MRTLEQIRNLLYEFPCTTTADQLVFADWLEENGDPYWAFFARLFIKENKEQIHFVNLFPKWIMDEIKVRGYKGNDPDISYDYYQGWGYSIRKFEEEKKKNFPVAAPLK